MAMNQHPNEDNSHMNGPIDLDTCEVWEEENEQEGQQTGVAAKDEKAAKQQPQKEVTTTTTTRTTVKKSTKATSQPFVSTLKQLIKGLSRSSKKADGNATDSDMSMSSSGPSSTGTFDHDDHHDTTENDPPIFHYKENARSPLLKNMDTSLYDNRLLLSSNFMEQPEQPQAAEHPNANRSLQQQPPFRQYLSFDGVVVL